MPDCIPTNIEDPIPPDARQVCDPSRSSTAGTSTQYSELLDLAEIVARARPAPRREFDQIPMRTRDLAKQIELIAPVIANKRVSFIGDMDGSASLLGLLGVHGHPSPSELLILDFDVRVLETAISLAERFGFSSRLRVTHYNCFEPLPPEIVGTSDWFYTNPPYGSRNVGASVRLFVNRGCETVNPSKGAGCIIIPDDDTRPWTKSAARATTKFLHDYGWRTQREPRILHRYHLDDDPELVSSLLLVNRIGPPSGAMPFSGRHVEPNELPFFYGRSTPLPFPKYIAHDGSPIGRIAG